MDDLIYVAIVLSCLALTFGLVRMCAALMPREMPPQPGSKS